MNGEIFQIISLKLFLIVSLTETADMEEVHTLAEYVALDCYISALVLLITLMERFQVHGYSWITILLQVYEMTKKLLEIFVIVTQWRLKYFYTH